MFLVLLGVGAFAVFNVYPFLAVSYRVPTDVMVVEGWIHDYAIADTVTEFQAGNYRRVFATGGPVAGSGGYTNDYHTYASVAAELLVAGGIPRDLVQIAPSRESGRDRTYSAALALGRLIREKGLEVHAVNVVTENAHSRRTLLLFQMALGSDIKVGVIPIASPDYDAGHWWRYSEGARDVIGESLAYIYAKVFFFPDKVDGLPPASERH